jgi:predicted nucleotidyltransferase
MATTAPLITLPSEVDGALQEFVGACRDAFGPGLRAVVLYGSAAEGRLRPTSDVNVIVVSDAFTAAAADRLREPFRAAQASIRLEAMFLLASEVEAAGHAFAAKFDDVLHRRRVIFGDDVFAALTIPRAALVARLKQVLLNTALRLRALYVGRGLHEEQLALAVADAAGGLRSAASALLELQGRPAASPRAALEAVAAALGAPALSEAVSRMPEARETARLPPGVAGPTLLRLIEVAERMRAQVVALG